MHKTKVNDDLTYEREYNPHGPEDNPNELQYNLHEPGTLTNVEVAVVLRMDAAHTAIYAYFF